MLVILKRDDEEISRQAAQLVASAVRKKPALTLGLATGGTMVGGRVSGPGQQRGKDMTGGQTYHLAKGDVIAIPAGVPHWFKEVPQSISYYVVKVIKQ